MSIKKLTALFASLVFVSYLAAEQPIEQPSNLSEVFENCSSAKLTFELTHDDEFDKEAYDEVAKKFLILVKTCQESESHDDAHDDAEFEKITNLVTELFKGLAPMIKNGNGIHGNLNISVESSVKPNKE